MAEVAIIIPSRFREMRPHSRTVKLAGTFINQVKIADEVKLHRSHLHRILSGEQVPTTRVARRIAQALGITMEDLLDLIDQHVEDVKARKAAE